LEHSMVIRLRPLAILLACAGLLGCATHPGDAGPDTGQNLPGTAQAAPVVYQIGKLPEPGQAVQTGR
jgi:hypothetical protein